MLFRSQNMGAIALFGEKYGDVVRAIRFGESLELCGGTHVKSTGQIGIFKIVSESSVAAGIRRIEAVVGDKAEEFFNAQSDILKELGQMLHKQKDLRKSVEAVLAENSSLAKQVEALKQSAIQAVKLRIKDDARKVGGVMLMHSVLKPMFGDSLKDIAFQLRSECDQDMVAVLGVESEDKAQLAVIVSDELANNGVLNAVDLIKAVSGMIDGGGGGQKFFATAGGKKPSGLNQAVEKTLSIIEEKLS